MCSFTHTHTHTHTHTYPTRTPRLFASQAKSPSMVENEKVENFIGTRQQPFMLQAATNSMSQVLGDARHNQHGKQSNKKQRGKECQSQKKLQNFSCRPSKEEGTGRITCLIEGACATHYGHNVPFYRCVRLS